MERPFGEIPPEAQPLETPEESHAVKRFVRMSPETAMDNDDEYAELFACQEELPDELEKTPEQRRVIEKILAALPAFVARYGGRALPLRPEHVHLFAHEKDVGTEYFGGAQRTHVAVRPGGRGSRNRFTADVIHELLHFNAFQSLEESAGREVSFRRGGLNVRVGGADVGTWLDEAMTEELTKRLFREREHDDAACWEEAEEARRLGRNFMLPGDPPEDEILGFEEPDSTDPSPTFMPFQYRQERRRLNEVLDGIVAESPDKFPDREAVFDVFARAYFSGNLLEIARMVERTYGRGAFRTMMEGRQMLPEPLYMQKQRQERRNRGNAGA